MHCHFIQFKQKLAKGRDTDGKTVQLVDMKYFCIVT